jgi:hypothetical protein
MPMTAALVPLNRDRHRHLRLAPNQPYHFARELMLCPVFSGELREVCRDYVIVFGAAGSPPQALLGSEQGVNAYVADSGHWLGRYVPAHLRRHPFYFAPVQGAAEGGQTFAVGIDETAPHLAGDQGEALFNADGTPAPLLERIKTALADLHRDGEATTKMAGQLDELGLLAERRLQLRRRDGSQRAIAGVRAIDTEKLAALDGDTLARLHRNGALMLAYAHLVSLANLRDGVLTHVPTPAAAAPGFNLGDTGLFDFSRLN